MCVCVCVCVCVLVCWCVGVCVCACFIHKHNVCVQLLFSLIKYTGTLPKQLLYNSFHVTAY